MSCVTALSCPILMSPARSWTSGLSVLDLAAAMNLAAAVASLKVSQKPWSAIERYAMVSVTAHWSVCHSSSVNIALVAMPSPRVQVAGICARRYRSTVTP